MRKPLRNVLFTFDYELYLGVKSGSVDNCLIAPTNRVIAILSKYDARSVFFVDTTYLLRLQQIKDQYPLAKADWEKIVAQLQAIFLLGHDIFPHLHPHWLDAVYKEETNEWDLTDFSRYRFNSISTGERDFIWSESIRILGDIVHPLNTGYQFNSYRAGGWSIQPFSDFKPYFEAYGIKYDFSVKPGYKQISNAQQYDFLNAPQKSVYSFGDDVVAENAEGRYTQYTTSSIRKLSGGYKFIDRVLNRLLPAGHLHGYGDGVTASPQSSSTGTKNDYFANAEMISIESLVLAKLPGHFKYLKQNNYMQFLSHPKMISEHNLFCLNVFLKHAKANYSLNTDFRKITLQE